MRRPSESLSGSSSAGGCRDIGLSEQNTNGKPTGAGGMVSGNARSQVRWLTVQEAEKPKLKQPLVD